MDGHDDGEWELGQPTDLDLERGREVAQVGGSVVGGNERVHVAAGAEPRAGTAEQHGTDVTAYRCCLDGVEGGTQGMGRGHRRR